jgi:hypothetical protein
MPLRTLCDKVITPVLVRVYKHWHRGSTGQLKRHFNVLLQVYCGASIDHRGPALCSGSILLLLDILLFIRFRLSSLASVPITLVSSWLGYQADSRFKRFLPGVSWDLMRRWASPNLRPGMQG